MLPRRTRPLARQVRVEPVSGSSDGMLVLCGEFPRLVNCASWAGTSLEVLCYPYRKVTRRPVPAVRLGALDGIGGACLLPIESKRWSPAVQ